MERSMRECFPVLIKTRAPSVLREAIKVAAEKELTTPSEWMRALLRQLREEGIQSGNGRLTGGNGRVTGGIG
jgi:hypothetical protein